MTRDWDATWARWREMTPEERAIAHAEINRNMLAAGARMREVCEASAKSLRAFADALNKMFG